jgi:hypothetical protein
MRRLALLLCALGASATAGAQERFCAGTSFAEGLTIGRIKPDAGRVFFRKNGDRKDACPSADAGCQDKAYLVAGDLVAMGARWRGFICVDFGAGGKDRAGWLPADAVEPAPLASDPAAWLGDWKRVEADISIEKTRDGLKATGEATFGAQDPDKARRGAIHFGSFSGPLLLKDGQATLVDSSDISACNLRLARAGDVLFVRDNMNCGGVNVSFSGLYRRGD